MSKGNELYVRKSRSSDPTVMSDTEDQMWDDSSMTAAYDKAINKANAEIAKQIAMETNSKFKENVPAKSANKKGKAAPKPKVWKEGMPCRAVFSEDERDYEAVIYAILDANECVVKFIGYDNTEIVNINTLMESRGDESRMEQIEKAAAEIFDDGFESLSNGESSPDPASSSHKGKKSKKAQRAKPPRYPNMANNPGLFQFNAGYDDPPLPDFRLPNIPFPPPLPSPLSLDSEEQALSSMLISWYMSGYHTGLYQGLKRSNENRRH